MWKRATVALVPGMVCRLDSGWTSSPSSQRMSIVSTLSNPHPFPSSFQLKPVGVVISLGLYLFLDVHVKRYNSAFGCVNENSLYSLLIKRVVGNGMGWDGMDRMGHEWGGVG